MTRGLEWISTKTSTIMVNTFLFLIIFCLLFFVSIIVYGSGNDGPSCSCRIESKNLWVVVLAAICIFLMAIFIYMVETISGQRHPS